MNKARRDDFRVEEEVRMNKAKFEETSEDVLRRMQDIKEAEVESIGALTSFLDAELEYHERCADELRRVRQSWAGTSTSTAPPNYGARPSTTSNSTRSRSNTARSWQDPRHRAVYEEPEPEPEREPVRIPTRSPGASRLAPPPPLPAQPPRPPIARASTFEGKASTPLSSLKPPVPQLSRVATVDTGAASYRSGHGNDDIFSDDISTGSRSGSPDNSANASPATSYGSLSRSTSALAVKKAAPPPPPVNRAKKPPPPPVPARRENLGC